MKIRDEAQDLDEREKSLKAKETQKIQQEVRAVKRELEAVLKDFENQLKTIDILEVNSLIKKSESAISSIIEAHQPSKELVRETGQSFYTPRVGEQVLLKSLGNKLATIVEEPGDDETVLVQYGKIRVRVDKSNIRALPTNSATVSVPSSRTQVSGFLKFFIMQYYLKMKVRLSCESVIYILEKAISELTKCNSKLGSGDQEPQGTKKPHCSQQH